MWFAGSPPFVVGLFVLLFAFVVVCFNSPFCTKTKGCWQQESVFNFKSTIPSIHIVCFSYLATVAWNNSCDNCATFPCQCPPHSILWPPHHNALAHRLPSVSLSQSEPLTRALPPCASDGVGNSSVNAGPVWPFWVWHSDLHSPLQPPPCSCL